jgi:hypothetical protein
MGIAKSLIYKRTLFINTVWDQGVQGSNPCTPTNNDKGLAAMLTLFHFCSAASVSAPFTHR